eukprot:maker-scaffold103_size370364-snap-gene-2.25 protein:Tk07521 transcript:maker-scaffold103_size370364-snap-gene-2.25-mRNA-1 annotation:"yrdc domain-containing mitochondrial-like"
MAQVVRLGLIRSKSSLVQGCAELMSSIETKIRPIRTNGTVSSVNAAQDAAQALLQGHVIATPTDTIYGLAALVQNPEAVHKLYAIKGRSESKPIAICVAQIEDIYRWSRVTVPRPVLEELLPGPVTVIFERREELNQEFNPHTHLIGIRIPDHAFIRQVCQLADGPIALTSANPSSAQSTLAVEEFRELIPKLHAVYDGGRLSDTEQARLGSTVVDLSEPEKFLVVREGSSLDNTLQTLKRFGLAPR